MLAFFGIIFVGLAIAGGFWQSRRAFHRRNSAGSEVFENYGEMVKTRFAEGIVKIAVAILGIGGFIAFAIGAS